MRARPIDVAVQREVWAHINSHHVVRPRELARTIVAEFSKRQVAESKFWSAFLVLSVASLIAELCDRPPTLPPTRLPRDTKPAEPHAA